MASPKDIADGPDGRLWFLEAQANQIGAVSTSGSFAEYAVKTRGADLQGIAAGPDGNVWFTEGDGGKIGRITPAGKITLPPRLRGDLSWIVQAPLALPAVRPFPRPAPARLRGQH